MQNFLHTLGTGIAGVALAIASFFGGTPAPVQAPAPSLGATNAIEAPVALFQTSLANGISSSATSMTLVSATTKNGTSLASSTYSFIIDEGTASEELVIADCTSTACTNMQRGLSVTTGTTTVATLQKAHRRGASVKITDAPVLIKTVRIINGIGTFPNIVSYTSHPTFTATTNIVDKKYVDDTAFSGAGVVDATSAARGVVELATGAEAAASTPAGSSGNLSLPASIATSTFNSLTAANVIPVTGGTGKLDNYFIATSTLFNSINLTGSTTASATTSVRVGAFPIWQIGKQFQAITTTGTSTLTVPSGISKIWVRLVAGGGTGSGAATNGTAVCGGSAGGYAEKMVDITGTSTIQVYVAPGATGVTSGTGNTGKYTYFGTNGFYFYATGGQGGLTGDNCVQAAGIGVNGDINIQGQAGSNATWHSTAALFATGGSSILGGGGFSTNSLPGYGGGSGGRNDGASTADGGQGAIFISW